MHYGPPCGFVNPWPLLTAGRNWVIVSPSGERQQLDCPRCRAPNPDTSRYCGTCTAPLIPPAPAASPPAAPPPDPPSDSPSLTTTIDPLARGLIAGTVIAGKYRLLGEIGRGGMGIVYEADDLKLRRSVALKFLPTELTDDPQARERFVHEAQAASVLDNPHICTIHEIGESEDRRMFIAMALCSGESLRAKVKRGPLDPAEALSIASQVADGLAAAHASGIIHRDIKPANILVTREGTARIADFGLAKITGEARLTRAGHAVGTVAYMSPEQLRGEDVDARTDVWSLGVVLYEMLTGALPFPGTTEHALAYAIVNSEPRSLALLPPGTPAGCAAVLERALAKDRAARFTSAVEMAEALAAVRNKGAGYSGHLSTAASGGRPASLPRPRPRRPAVVRFGLPVLAVAAALSASLVLHAPRRLALLLGLARPAGGRHITVFVPNVIGDSAEDRVLAAGLAEYLRLRLDEIARRSRSWVTPGEHLDTYEVREASDAFRVLGSNVVLSGTFRRAGDNISLNLDVIDPANYRRLSSLSKTDHIANIATWQVDLVLETASALGLPLVPAPQDSSASSAASGRASALFSAAGTTVPGAFEAYLRGLGLITSPPVFAGPSSTQYADTLSSAITAFEEAVRLDPSFADASIELADAFRQKTSSEKDQAPALHADALIRSLLNSHDGLARAHLVRGSILRRLGRNDEAGAEFERASALDPLSYDALIKLAIFYEDANEPAKAEAAYRAALRARPGYWAGATYLGIFFLYQGAFDKARDELESVTRACPGNFIALNDLGAAYFKLGEYDRSIAVFERSNSIKRNPDASANLATLYYYSGRYADSVSMNEAALGFGRSDFDYVIWGNIGDGYRFTPGNEAKGAEAYRKAIELTEQVLAIDPNDSRARGNMAAALAKAGQVERARKELESVLRAKPGDTSILLRAVFVYELIGARAQALEAVREYVRLGGPMEEIVRDPLLAALRQDPGFADIIRK